MKSCLRLKSICLATAALLAISLTAAAQQLKPTEIIYSRMPSNLSAPPTGANSPTIWAVGQDGSNDRQIAAGRDPRVSDDGRYLLFRRTTGDIYNDYSHGELWVRELASGAETKVLEWNAFSFVLGYYFSPRSNQGSYEIIYSLNLVPYKMNLDGTNRTQLPSGDPYGTQTEFPVARRGDSLLAFDNFQDRRPNGDGPGLMTEEIDGANRRHVPNTDYGDFDASWSNDAQYIGFGSYPPGSGSATTHPYIVTNLFKIKPDGTGRQQLTNLVNNTGQGTCYANSDCLTVGMVWTDDNSKIIVAGRVGGATGIFAFNTDGSGAYTRIPVSAGPTPDAVGGIVQPRVEQQVHATAGGLISGGNGALSLLDTIGEPVAGQSVSGGGFKLQIGFPLQLATVLNTPAGANVTVRIDDASVAFASVSREGTTTFTPIEPSSAGPPPDGFTFCPACPAYDITTTAAYSPPVNVCLYVPSAVSQQTFNALRLLHSENHVLVDRTTGHLTDQDGRRRVCGSVSSLSPFVLVQPSADGAGTLQFSQPTYTAGEASATATVTVTRTGGSTGAASVQYATSDGAARGGASCAAGVDYVTTSGTLEWSDGDAASKSFSVTVCDDTLFENDETVLLTLTNANGASLGATSTAALTIRNDDAPPPQPALGSVIISEFRLRGPDPDGAGPLTGALDEFIELYNANGSDIYVGDPNSAGWALVASNGATVITIPNGTRIPARGHLLVANSTDSGGYSLGAYTVPDLTYAADIPDDTGLALFATAAPAGFDTAHCLDAVGFTITADALYREGAGLAPLGATDGQKSWVRKLTTGAPQDTDDNASDFVLVSTDPTAVAGSTLGAPGPEGTQAPLNTGGQIKSSLFGSCMGSSETPNRERVTASYNDTVTPSSPNGADPATNPYAPGTMRIRRRFTNSTGGTVTTLRFRVVNMTAGPASGGTADVRLLTSGDEAVVVNPCPGGPTSSKGLTLEQPPAQAMGGGLNSTVASGYVSVNQLAPGDSVDLNFLLGVAQTGNFSFFVVVEAVPGPTPSAAAPAAWQTAPTNFEGGKGGGKRRSKDMEWGKHPTLYEEEEEN